MYATTISLQEEALFFKCSWKTIHLQFYLKYNKKETFIKLYVKDMGEILFFDIHGKSPPLSYALHMHGTPRVAI